MWSGGSCTQPRVVTSLSESRSFSGRARPRACSWSPRAHSGILFFSQQTPLQKLTPSAPGRFLVYDFAEKTRARMSEFPQRPAPLPAGTIVSASSLWPAHPPTARVHAHTHTHAPTYSHTQRKSGHIPARPAGPRVPRSRPLDHRREIIPSRLLSASLCLTWLLLRGLRGLQPPLTYIFLRPPPLAPPLCAAGLRRMRTRRLPSVPSPAAWPREVLGPERRRRLSALLGLRLRQTMPPALRPQTLSSFCGTSSAPPPLQPPGRKQGVSLDITGTSHLLPSLPSASNSCHFRSLRSAPARPLLSTLTPVAIMRVFANLSWS